MSGIAKIAQIRQWSPIWIVPIVTLLIGVWIVFYHLSHQGVLVTLRTSSAEGIQAGKTALKSRSVDVGIVEKVTLSEDLSTVILRARLNNGMERLLRKDSVFWVVKPQIGREGVSGLGTLFSGAYIELQPGQDKEEARKFVLLDAPPLAAPDAKGIRIELDSKEAGKLNAGDPVLYRGYKVGSVESSAFDPLERTMRYRLFIAAPFDSLVTKNVRFWQESGVSFNMGAEGMRVEMGSLSTLLNSGVSFDVPEGWELGEPAQNEAHYQLYANKNSIQESLYTVHEDFLVLFEDSIRGLQPGAPVEFRGVRLGTVSKVPYFMPDVDDIVEKDDPKIPVLLRIEPERLDKKTGKFFDIRSHLLANEQSGLRASLKSANLLTGALYVDLDFYPNAEPWQGPKTIKGYPVLPSESGGLAQVQQKFVQALDKFNALPLDKTVTEVNQTLVQSRHTLKEMQSTLKNINQLSASPEMQQLPKDIQNTLRQLDSSLQGFQPGSPAYNKLVTDMQRLDQVLKELEPLLRTLNSKSNALVFEASTDSDPKPKKAEK